MVQYCELKMHGPNERLVQKQLLRGDGAQSELPRLDCAISRDSQHDATMTRST